MTKLVAKYTALVYLYHVHNMICVPSFAPLTESSDPIPAPMSQWESGDPIGGDGGKIHALCNRN